MPIAPPTPPAAHGRTAGTAGTSSLGGCGTVAKDRKEGEEPADPIHSDTRTLDSDTHASPTSALRASRTGRCLFVSLPQDPSHSAHLQLRSCAKWASIAPLQTPWYPRGTTCLQCAKDIYARAATHLLVKRGMAKLKRVSCPFWSTQPYARGVSKAMSWRHVSKSDATTRAVYVAGVTTARAATALSQREDSPPTCIKSTRLKQKQLEE